MSAQSSLRRVNEDRRVADDVRAELEILGITHQGFLDIIVEEGVVTLTGIVEGYAQKYVIERAASRVIGVRDVRDYLEVHPGDPERGDGLIASAARHALAWDAMVPASVGIEVTDGVLRLHGMVDRFAEREAAEGAVRNLVGVRDVINEIRIAPPAPAPDVAGEVESALRRRFGMACRQVWTIERGGVVTVSGVVATLEQVGAMERAVQSVPGVVHVDNRLLVA